MIRNILIAVALATILSVAAEGCFGGKSTQSPATQPRNDPRDRPAPASCLPNYDMRRISNREFRCIIRSDRGFLSISCPSGWTERRVKYQHVKNLDIIYSYECFND